MTRVFRRRRSFTDRNDRAVVEAIESRQLLAASVSFVNVPISSAAKAADPTLNNLRTVDVQLKMSGDDDWLAGDLKLKLTKGSFYNPRAGGNTPNKAVWSALKYLEFDTFVSAPNFTAPTILGRKEGSGSAVFSPSEVNVAWGDLADTGAGTFTIARLTMSSDAAGQINGNVFVESVPGTAFPFVNNVSTPTPTISGRVYNDTNANGKQDRGEPNLSRWQVFIDKDNDGRLDGNETSVRTNSKGNYTFTNPGNTSHRIRVRLQDTFRRSAPGSGSFNVALGAGVIATDKNFGVTQRGKIAGSVFRDSDNDRSRDSGESGMSGWRVFIDKDGDRRYDRNETSVRTSSDGSFKFDGLFRGTYEVCITQVGGFTRTTPSSGTFSVKVVNGTERNDIRFGQRAA